MRASAIVAAIALLVSACGGPSISSPVVVPSAQPSISTGQASAEATASASLSTAPLALTWTRALVDPSALVMDVSVSPGTTVAVGGRGARAGAWTSADGTSWRPAVIEAPAYWLQRVIRGPTGYVALGCAAPVGGNCGTPAAWTSADGRRWVIHRMPTALTYDRVSDAAMVGSTFVAVGSATDCPQDVGSDGIELAAAKPVGCGNRAIAWWSVDGAAWHLATIKPPGAGIAAVASIAGGAVALSSFGDRLVWHSTDGRSWAGAISTSMTFTAADMVALPDGEVLATDGLFLWTSVDGKVWAPAAGRLPGSASIDGFAGIDGGAVAIGTSDHDAAGGSINPPHLAAWISADGTSWRRLPDDPALADRVPARAASLGDQLAVAANNGPSASEPGGSILVARPVGP
jgi:hypothetical protein